jgi:hypothetical protein
MQKLWSHKVSNTFAPCGNTVASWGRQFRLFPKGITPLGANQCVPKRTIPLGNNTLGSNLNYFPLGINHIPPKNNLNWVPLGSNRIPPMNNLNRVLSRNNYIPLRNNLNHVPSGTLLPTEGAIPLESNHVPPRRKCVWNFVWS